MGYCTQKERGFTEGERVIILMYSTLEREERERVMTIAQQIQHQVQTLPENFQKEALPFIEFLPFKIRQGKTPQEEGEISWNNFSLTMAMRGMEEEEGAEY